MASGDAQIEATPRPPRQRIGDQPIGVRRQRRVGMQEQECRAAAERGAGVHRRAAAARGGDDAVGEGSCKRGRAVAAAAVDHDHFGAAATQRRQRFERGDHDCRLVENRQHDC